MSFSSELPRRRGWGWCMRGDLTKGGSDRVCLSGNYSEGCRKWWACESPNWSSGIFENRKIFTPPFHYMSMSIIKIKIITFQYIKQNHIVNFVAFPHNPPLYFTMRVYLQESCPPPFNLPSTKYRSPLS